MPTQTLNPTLQGILGGRYIATLGTENADGTIHLTAVWYLFEHGYFSVATSSKSRKARNLAARPKASLMVDVRNRHVHVRSAACGLRGPALIVRLRRAGDLPVLVHVVSQRARVLRLRRTETATRD